jgi:hypothetical protein
VLVNITDITAFNPVYVLNRDTQNEVFGYLRLNYPLAGLPGGEPYLCFYQIDTQTQKVHVQFQLNDAMGPLYAGYVFCGIAATALLVWILIECVLCCPSCLGGVADNLFQCCHHCRSNIRMKREQRAYNARQAEAVQYEAEINAAPKQSLSKSQLIIQPSAPPSAADDKDFA